MIDGVAVSGRVDRIDREGARAIIRDYKGRTVYPGARWDQIKLTHVQASHLRLLTPAQVAAQALPFIRARGLSVQDTDPRLAAAIVHSGWSWFGRGMYTASTPGSARSA